MSPGANTPCSTYPFSCEGEHGDRLVAGVDDPVLGNARLGIVGALDDQIPVGVVRADDLGDQIGTQPVAVPAAGIRAVAEQQKVGFAELALADAQAQRGEHHDAPCASRDARGTGDRAARGSPGG